MSSGGPVVLAPDKFKGSLTGAAVAAHLATGLRRFRPDVEIRQAPVADGGDGTLAAVSACGFTLVPVTVSGPTGHPVRSGFARRGTSAVVELADASGLRRLTDGLDPMRASSRGTGELIRAALDAGCDQIVVGLGGSAGTDGGAGMLQALGVRLLDEHGREIGDGGAAALPSCHAVDLTGLDPRLDVSADPRARGGGARIVLASDVDNPLLGVEGAAVVYAPQKGADPRQVAELETSLQQWARLLHLATGQDRSGLPGAGAAGGVGFAALSVLAARRRPGIALILELIGFEALLAGAALVITGEGSLDEQSLRGKAPVGVAEAAARHQVPAIAVAGRCALAPERLRAGGLAAGYALTGLEPDPAICMRDAGRLLEELAATVVGPAWLVEAGARHA